MPEISQKNATLSPARTGLWGGSFNPPTIAHKRLAEFVFSELSLTRLLWVVSPHNPEKDAATLAPFHHRLAMVNQVLKDHPQMKASDIEEVNGSSWTIDTVRAWRDLYPEDYLFWIMGMDNWLGFHNWGRDHEKILDYVSLVILQRPGYAPAEEAEASRRFKDLRVDSPEKLQKSGTWCLMEESPLLDVAATRIRQALKNTQETAPQDIDEAIFTYIKAHGLYASQG